MMVRVSPFVLKALFKKSLFSFKRLDPITYVVCNYCCWQWADLLLAYSWIRRGQTESYRSHVDLDCAGMKLKSASHDCHSSGVSSASPLGRPLCRTANLFIKLRKAYGNWASICPVVHNYHHPHQTLISASNRPQERLIVAYRAKKYFSDMANKATRLIHY